MKTAIISLLVLVYSCAHMNTDSRDYYNYKRVIRHGFTPPKVLGVKVKLKKSDIDFKRARRGKLVYKNNCFECHGSKGLGNGPLAKKYNPRPRNLVKVVRSNSNIKFFLKVSEWVNKMPGWKAPLTEKDKEDLVEYLKVLAI